MLLLLVPLAHAVEPDLSGIHLSVGAGLASSLGPDGVYIGVPAYPALCLHAGPAWMIEAIAAGGAIHDAYDDTTTTGADAEISRASRSDLTGWSASAALRVRARVARGGPVGFFVGPFGAIEGSSLTGPVALDRKDPDTGDVTVDDVFDRTESATTWSVGASASALTWLSGRVGVSGTLDLPVYEVEDARTDDVPRDAASDEHGVTINHASALGLWPRVGVQVNFLI